MSVLKYHELQLTNANCWQKRWKVNGTVKGRKVKEESLVSAELKMKSSNYLLLLPHMTVVQS